MDCRAVIGQALVASRVGDSEERCGELPGVSAGRPDDFGRVNEKELSHLVVGQLPNRHSKTQDRLCELFRA